MANYKKNLEEVAEHLQDNEEIKYSVFVLLCLKDGEIEV
jgi:hypothetical protein